METGPYPRRKVLSLGASTLVCGPLGHACLGEPTPTRFGPETNGTILMCGGGKLPDSLLDRFCELSDHMNSRLVLLPTASERSDTGDYSPWLELWKQRGWRDVQVVHADHQRAAMHADFAKQIDQASAVWITGGDQSRLADRFLGTPFIHRLHQLFQRGGVLGGTSAGAAIMSETMIASGAEEPVFGKGFGFLPRVIVDQHFQQKNRFERLSKAIERHPEQIGVGLDESTGIELTVAKATVIGNGQVYGYRAGNKPTVWGPGDTIDWNHWSELFCIPTQMRE